MTSIILVLTVCFLLLVLAFIKNEINFFIRKMWIDEVYKDTDWVNLRQKLPDYRKTLYDLTLWKHESFKSYIIRKGL